MGPGAVSAAQRLVYPVLGLLVIAAVWEGAIVVFGIPTFVLPSLPAIAKAIAADLPALLAGLRVTLYEAAVGYVLGGAVAIALALAFVLAPLLERAAMPIIVAVNSVPVVAYAPVALVALGMGSASKIAMVALAAGFAVFVNAMNGLKAIDPAAVNLMRSFGAGALRTVWILRLPAALPAIVSGLRVAIVRSIIIAIVAEMLGAYAGLGQMIYLATQQVDFLRVWAAIVVASVASMTLYGLFAWVDRRLVWWK
ncbi:MAG: ABC transporter permease [Alphaproteobacteria bacterium]|nr:ABC transporter permease [Alphaproteobacteria bacterium]